MTVDEGAFHKLANYPELRQVYTVVRKRGAGSEMGTSGCVIAAPAH